MGDMEKFNSQRQSSKIRGISFEFTLDEWTSWWEVNLGPEWRSLRGRKRGQYVMARKGDRGPYSIDNIECLVNTQNNSDQKKNRTSSFGERNGMSILTEDIVKEIFHSPKGQYILAKEYGITQQTVSMIQSKKIWQHITEKEERLVSKGHVKKDGTRGYPGVCWYKKYNKWHAADRKDKHIGYFDKEEDAINARMASEESVRWVDTSLQKKTKS